VRLSTAKGVVVEEMGDDLIVMIPHSSEVLKLTGESAEIVRAVRSGLPVVPGKVVDDLKAVGVLESPSLTRRGLVKGGAIGVGAGIAVLAMPGVAAADSTRIKLVGEWWWGLQTSTARFRIEKKNNVDSFPDFQTDAYGLIIGTFDLTVNGIQNGVSQYQYGSFGDKPTDGNYLLWYYPTDAAKNVYPPVEQGDGPAVGIFDYNGLRYEVRFSEIPDPYNN
jgi:hypothetical protein